MVEHIRNHYLKRSTLFQAFETQVAKLKSSRDINAFQVRVLYFSVRGIIVPFRITNFFSRQQQKISQAIYELKFWIYQVVSNQNPLSLTTVWLSFKNRTSNLAFLRSRRNIDWYLGSFFRAYRDFQSTHAQLVERLVSGKINKAQFVDAEALLTKKRDELVEKLNHLINTL